MLCVPDGDYAFKLTHGRIEAGLDLLLFGQVALLLRHALSMLYLYKAKTALIYQPGLALSELKNRYDNIGTITPLIAEISLAISSRTLNVPPSPLSFKR